MADARDEAVERVAAVICATPVDVADSLRLWQRYLSEKERERWRAEARPIVDAMVELGWTPPAAPTTKADTLRSAFQPLGDGKYRVSGARVSPTTGRYLTNAALHHPVAETTEKGEE